MKKYFIGIILSLLSIIVSAQIKKDTVIYNYIYRDTIVYVTKEENKNWVDLSNWGIGPYAGVDYTYSQYWGGGFNYSFGFGVQYYIWRLPSFKKKKKIREQIIPHK